MSAMSCFESCPLYLREMVGIVAYTTGSRPSSLFDWDDPADMRARLMFDGKVMQHVLPKIMQMQAAALMGGGQNGQEGL